MIKMLVVIASLLGAVSSTFAQDSSSAAEVGALSPSDSGYPLYSKFHAPEVRRMKALIKFNVERQRQVLLQKWCGHTSEQALALEQSLNVAYKFPEFLTEDMSYIRGVDIKKPSADRQLFVLENQVALDKDIAKYQQSVLSKVSKTTWCKPDLMAEADVQTELMFETIKLNHRLRWLGRYRADLDKTPDRSPTALAITVVSTAQP